MPGRTSETPGSTGPGGPVTSTCLEAWIDKLRELGPFAAWMIGVGGVLFLADFVLRRNAARVPGRRLRNQLTITALALLAALVLILNLPLEPDTRSDLLSLFGILLSAAIALSATTFLGNAMAGVMLRAVDNFSIGDYVRVGEHFGRISERGLFHVEIQTEERDLMTLPNLHLVTNPVTVVRKTGTIVSAELSLGYDVPRKDIEACLLQAAEEAGLEEPFVQIPTLGDFSVTYRIAGLLTDLKRLISTRTKLRAAALDSLHRASIEIVSPTFMNTRAFRPTDRFIPRTSPRREEADSESAPEAVVFDKAEAATVEEGRRELGLVEERLGELDQKLTGATGDAADVLRKERDELEARREELTEALEPPPE